MRPSTGTLTGRVWQIADALSGQLGRQPTRGEVIAAFSREGGNENTASTQFHFWRKAQASTGKRQPDQQASRPAVDGLALAASPERHWAGLLKNGFTYGADWTLSSSQTLELDRPAPAQPGVYVFVEDDQVIYVGTTKRTLAARMADYRRGNANQSTSRRINASLIEMLLKGHAVRVLFASPGQSEWNGLPVDLSAGLEAGLISRFAPVWNLRGLA